MVNKKRKGFTLIEMMIVIAVVAVLVSIIIPVVGNSTVKANAATNAANLRSVEGQVTSGKLLGDFTIADGIYTYFAENESFSVMGNIPAPNAEECFEVAEDTPMRLQIETDGSATATYRGYGVDYFAYIAEFGKEPENYELSGSDQFLNTTEDILKDWNIKVDSMNEEQLELFDKLLGLVTLGQYDSMQEFLHDAEQAIKDNHGQVPDEWADVLNDVLLHECNHSGLIGLCSCGGNKTLCIQCGIRESTSSGAKCDICGSMVLIQDDGYCNVHQIKTCTAIVKKGLFGSTSVIAGAKQCGQQYRDTCPDPSKHIA